MNGGAFVRFLISRFFPLSAVLCCFLSELHPQTPFSLDSASSYLKTLSVEIGPRPMGSPNERKAMEFGVSKFRQFGLHEAYVMPMKTTLSHEVGGIVNTNSGIAIGVLKGKSQRIIVIGGHIDSANPEVPGANDDGSGSAVVIELARVLALGKNESTIVFALFGGEEEGLRGSRYFVENFPLIDSVAFMVQVDMANGSDWLLPLLDSKNHSAPQWLVEAAYEEYRALGYSGFSYPTHFMSLSSLFGSGAITSDHLPFLERGIPAIDFTSDVNDPIHTAQDTYENFKIEGLKRSGDLVYRLVERFDGGVPARLMAGGPEERNDRYVLVDFWMIPLFIPFWTLLAFIGLAIVISLFAVRRLHVKYLATDRTTLPKWSGMKLFFFMLIIQTCVWFSENIVGLIKGDRFPWIADPGGYIALGFIAATVGIWIALRFSKTLRLTTDPYPYFLRSVVFLVVFIFLLGLLSVRAAVYPAAALFFLSLAMLFSNPLAKILFWIASPYMMYRLIFSEGFELVARSIALSPSRDFTAGVILHLVFIVFFSLWSFPFLLGFASINRDANSDLLWLRKFSTNRGLGVALFTFAILVVFLSAKPSYNELWKPNLLVDRKVNLTSGETTLSLSSSEYFKNISLHSDDFDTTLTGWSTTGPIKRTSMGNEAWLNVDHEVEVSGDSVKQFQIYTRIRMRHRPYHLVVTYSSGNGKMLDFAAPYESSPSNRDSTESSVSGSAEFAEDSDAPLVEVSATLRWYSFPDTVINVAVSFKVSGADSVAQGIEAVFVQPYGNTIVSGYAGNISYRTLLYKHTLHR